MIRVFGGNIVGILRKCREKWKR